MIRLPSDLAIGHLLEALRNLHTKPRDKTAPDRTLITFRRHIDEETP